ncbi:MAG: hypothetical protein ACTSUE_06225 [Promethearchaeota archaeon]
MMDAKRKFIFLINLILIIVLCTWVVIVLQVLGWHVPVPVFETLNKEWELEKNLLFIVTSGIFFFISIKLFIRFKRKGKASVLLLGYYNMIYGLCTLVEAVGNVLNFPTSDLLNTSIQNATYFLFGWATVFYYLFFVEIFMDSFTNKENTRSHAFFFPLIGFSLIVIVVSSIIPSTVALFNGALVIIIATTFVLATRYTRVSLQLRKNSREKVTRDGMLMIGLAGFMMMGLLVSFVMKAIKISPLFEVIVPGVSLALTAFTYVGFIHPSRRRSKTSPGDADPA